MLCLAAGIGVVALWARGVATTDVVAFCTPGGRWQAAASMREGLAVFLSDVPGGHESGGTFHTAAIRSETFDRFPRRVFDPAAVNASAFGFKVASGTLAVGSRRPAYHAAVVPHWAALALLVPPGVWFRNRLRTWRRVRRGACRGCGYDLRGSFGRCPECGFVAPVPSPPRATGRVLAIIAIGAAAAVVEVVPQVAGEGPDDSRELVLSMPRILPEVTFDDVRFDDAVKFLAEVIGITVRRDTAALAEVGITPETPVRGHWRNVRASGAFAVFFKDLPAPLELICEEDGTFTLTPRRAAVEVRLHDVRDILEWEFQPDEPDKSDEPDEGRTRAEIVEEIVTLCCETVDPDSWYVNGGDVGWLVGATTGSLLVP